MNWLSAALLGGFLLSAPALAQEVHHHAGKSDAIDRFYSSWAKPDKPQESCCSHTDCDEAEMRVVDGQIWAKRKRDSVFRFVPPQKVEQHRDSPDGRNHLCAPNWNTTETFCFIAGSGT